MPASLAEGTEAAALGRLAAFVDALFVHVTALGKSHTPAAWPDVVGAALDALCVNDAESAWQHQELREALTLLAARASAAGYDEPVGGAAFGELLFETINTARPGRGFLMGGVTFCSMVPLRTIPFRVVCILGLGDGQFPRKELSNDFDLIAHGPEGRRLGDRSRRSDDRYLFLEAILSARERLLITYTGQSIRDNSALPPSVLVNELCDYLAAAHGPAVSSSEAVQSCIVRHPLQAFSPRYFDGQDPRLFSYAEHYVEGAAARGLSGVMPPEFFPAPLPTPPPSGVLTLEDLCRFYQNPTAYLLNRRLELFLRERDLDVPDREPQELSPLDKYGPGSQLLELMLRGVPDAEAKRLIQATGALPLGAPGELDFLEITASATAIAERVRHARGAPRKPPVLIEQRLPGGRQLLGNLSESFGDGLLEYQFARVQPKHLLGLWIRHLSYCWQGPLGNQAQSQLIGRPPQGQGVILHRFRAVANPQDHLEALVRLYDAGQTLPLRLFPATSFCYAEALRNKPKSKAELAATLAKEWQAEIGRDAHLARVYDTTQRLSELRLADVDRGSFHAVALEVYGPLLDHLEAGP